MVSFEIENCPNGQNVTNDQFRAIGEVVASDPLYYDYVITEARETGGLYFLIVERLCPKYRHSLTFFRVDVGGDWGVLYECKPTEDEEEEDGKD